MLTGCSTAPILGGDDPIAKGAASGQQAVAATEKLERCTEPLGTVGFAEAGDDPYVPIVQMLVQQSNCFIVVERGRAYNQIDLERQLKEAGLTGQAGAANRKMLAADYTMVPTVTFAEPSGFGLSTGLGGFGLGGLFGRRGNNIDTSAQVQALGASTTLRLIDNSSGAQIVAAQGSAKNYNLGAGVGLLGGMLAGVNAYASTPQGKIVTAAFLDAYNKLVQAARQYLPQQTHGSAGQGGRLQGPQ
jgi:curli biogenesis system outer membrane secretion channel CsgG